MGQAAARKVTEIEESRQRLEQDLQELEDRMPAALRSVKSLVGVLLGLLAVLLHQSQNERPSTST